MSEQEDYSRAGTLGAHKTTHEDGGSDQISVQALSGLLTDDQHVLDSEVKLIKLDGFATPDDNTLLNASTSRHGLLRKLSNVVTQYLNGQGAWTTPPDTTVPYAHKTTHQDGGADQIIVAGLSGVLADPQHLIVAEAKAIKLDDFTAPDDNTDLNASTSKHGLLKKLSNVVTEFMNGLGGWSVPPGGGGLPLNYISGGVLALDADALHDVNVTSCLARDSTDSEDITLASEITKQIDVGWSVGDDAGGLDTGAVGNGLHYAVWLIKRSDTGVEDVLFSLSFTAPTMPGSYDYKRLIGWVLTDSSANLVGFRTVGSGTIVEYWFTVRQQIASGLSSSILTSQAVNAVIPTDAGFDVLAFFTGTANVGSVGLFMASDASNVRVNMSTYASLNNPNLANAVGASTQPFFIPIIGNDIYYGVTASSIVLYVLAIKILR